MESRVLFFLRLTVKHIPLLFRCHIRICDETAAFPKRNQCANYNETQITSERAGITKIFLARKEFAALSRTPQHRKKLSDIGG